MAFLTISEMRARGEGVVARERNLGKTSRTIIAEAVAYDPDRTYDIFLSHSSQDRALVLGVKDRLEGAGLSVYVDWISDAELDRTAVTPANAERLRTRMRSCRSLLYLATENASHSKWMPWELGFFDGLDNGEIGILPVLEGRDETFDGMEFLGLYSIVELRPRAGGGSALFIRRKDGSVERLRNLFRKAG